MLPEPRELEICESRLSSGLVDWLSEVLVEELSVEPVELLSDEEAL